MTEFVPDHKNLENAARNTTARRLPLYEHSVAENVMEKILGREFASLQNGDEAERREFFKTYNSFYKQMKYDTVSFERNIGRVMPGSGALDNHVKGAIRDMEDFKKYPWDEIPDIYFARYDLDYQMMGETLPEGMKAVGGPGYGLFELTQDMVGYESLCMISVDDPELYALLFERIGQLMYKIWERFLARYGGYYAVCRFGDDLGFKSNTLLSPEDIRRHIIPQYKKMSALIHSYNKPFLLHSCGNIFNIMEDLISVVKIDAKHSNEDQIAPFSKWVDLYGARIGNFGGVDMDHLCSKSEVEIKEITRDVINYTQGKGGFAVGSGNSIPDYVPPEGYLAMLQTVWETRE